MSYNCTKCGNGFQKESRFCQICGCNLEYIANAVCPKCKKTFPANSTFCINDGSKLIRPEDLIPKCVICNTSYSDDTKFCTKDGGEVKFILTRQFDHSSRKQNQSFQSFETNQKYPKASLNNRFLAALLDGLISIGLSIPSIIFYKMAEKSYYDYDRARGLLIIAFIFYLIASVYNFIKDGLGQGQSLGKKAFDIMVVNLGNNKPCDKGRSFFRNFISGLVIIIPLAGCMLVSLNKVYDFAGIMLLVGYIIEPIMVLVNKEGRKIGDITANTQVINKIKLI